LGLNVVVGAMVSDKPIDAPIEAEVGKGYGSGSRFRNTGQRTSAGIGGENYPAGKIM